MRAKDERKDCCRYLSRPQSKSAQHAPCDQPSALDAHDGEDVESPVAERAQERSGEEFKSHREADQIASGFFVNKRRTERKQSGCPAFGDRNRCLERQIWAQITRGQLLGEKPL